MKLRLLLLSMLSVLALLPVASAAPAAAQTNTDQAALDSVTLWLYPEYDDPRLLVMMEGELTGATLPTAVRFLVPQGAEMFSAGSKDAQGNYTGGPPDRKASDIAGWDEVSYQLSNPTFRVEYYADQIKGQPDKRIGYDFLSLYPVRTMHIFVQQPLTASNFAVSPSGTATKEGAFNVQVLTYSNLTPDPAKPLHLDISYTKADSSLSVENTSVGGPPVGSAGSTGSSGFTGPVILALVLGAMAIASIFFWLGSRFSRRRYALSAVSPTPRGSPPPSRLKNSAAPSEPQQSVVSRERRRKSGDFCTQCGATLDKNDRFCTSCGARLE